MPYDLAGNFVSDEEARRGLLADQQNAQTNATPAATPIVTSGFTYNNGNHFAGTNVPMSDQAYGLLSQNGTRPIATDRDVLGGGHYGVRGFMHDHPEATLAAFILAAAGGAALAGGAGAAGGGGAAAAGEGAAGTAAGGAAAGIGGGTAAAGTAAGAALPEIVVTGTVPAGITAGEAAGIGAGVGGFGSALANSGASTGSAPTDYGEYGGWQATSDPVGEFGQGIGTGSDAGDLAAGNGGGGLLSNLSTQDYIKLGQGLLGGGGQQQQGGAVVIAPQAPQNNPSLLMQLMRTNRAQELRRKIKRTPAEDEELRQLSGFSHYGLVA